MAGVFTGSPPGRNRRRGQMEGKKKMGFPIQVLNPNTGLEETLVVDDAVSVN
jgi:hypothetical protein